MSNDIDEPTKQYVFKWYEQEHDRAKTLVEDARDAKTVGESTELAHKAKLHLGRAQAYQSVLALIGYPEDNDNDNDDDE